MAVVIPISDVLKTNEDEIIPAVRGKVVNVDKRIARDDWSFQKITIEDRGSKIKLKMWGREDLGWTKGKTVIAESVSGQRGMHGIRRKSEGYQGKTYAYLDVSEKASFGEVGQTQDAPQDDGGYQEAPPARNAAPASNGAQNGGHYQNGSNGGNGGANGNGGYTGPGPVDSKAAMASARKRLGKVANAMELCFGAAIYVQKRVYAVHNVGLSESEVEKMAISMLIDLIKEGLLDAIPVGELDQFLLESYQGQPQN